MLQTVNIIFINALLPVGFNHLIIDTEWSPLPDNVSQIKCLTPSRRTPCGHVEEFFVVEKGVVVECSKSTCLVSCAQKNQSPSSDALKCLNRERKLWNLPAGFSLKCEFRPLAFDDVQEEILAHYNRINLDFDNIDVVEQAATEARVYAIMLSKSHKQIKYQSMNPLKHQNQLRHAQKTR